MCIQTSALDTYTENEVMRNINSILLLKKRTSIFVAHRLKTVADADLIIVLSDGAVAEEGTHAELLAHGGVYAKRKYTSAFEKFIKLIIAISVDNATRNRS